MRQPAAGGIADDGERGRVDRRRRASTGRRCRASSSAAGKGCSGASRYSGSRSRGVGRRRHGAGQVPVPERRTRHIAAAVQVEHRHGGVRARQELQRRHPGGVGRRNLDLGRHRELRVQRLARGPQVCRVPPTGDQRVDRLPEPLDALGEFAADRSGRRDRLVEIAQQFAGPVEEGLAGQRQLDPVRRPPQQVRPDQALQRADLAAQRRLGQEQPGGGPAEVQLLRNGDERAQMPQARSPPAPTGSDSTCRRHLVGHRPRRPVWPTADDPVMQSTHERDTESAFPLAGCADARVGACRCETTASWRCRVADVQLRGTGGRLPARVYWPAPTDIPAPLLVAFASSDVLAREMCRQAGVIAMSAMCRSATVDDAAAALCWSADHAAELDADPGVLFVAGEGPGCQPRLGRGATRALQPLAAHRASTAGLHPRRCRAGVRLVGRRSSPCNRRHDRPRRRRISAPAATPPGCGRQASTSRNCTTRVRQIPQTGCWSNSPGRCVAKCVDPAPMTFDAGRRPNNEMDVEFWTSAPTYLQKRPRREQGDRHDCRSKDRPLPLVGAVRALRGHADDRPRRDDRERGTALHPGRPRLLAEQPRLGRERIPHRLRRPAAARRADR